MNLPPAWSQILTYAALYTRQPEPSDATLRGLLEGRRALAQAWVEAPTAATESMFHGDAGRAHAALQDLHLKLIRITPSGEAAIAADEAAFVRDLIAAAGRGWGHAGALQTFLAASLYVYPHELPRTFELTALPAWFVRPYVMFMLQPPPLVTRAGESVDYLNYVEAFTTYLAGHDADIAPWSEASLAFAERANYIPLYFNDQNLKRVFSQRGDLLEAVLARHGHQTAYTFPPDRRPGPIRLGVIAPAFLPSAETSASLPIYEHLDSGEFEVTLYALHETNHPIERYCRSRAHAFRALPPGLMQQATLVRGDDLDILFFASNVAAVTNPLALLAAHRVARRQVTSIFSIVTSGFRHMDVYLSGTATDPMPDAQDHYRERLLKMDGSVHCFSNPPVVAATAPSTSTAGFTREASAIPPDAIVFASGANMYKLIPELVATYAKVLAGVPGSILLLCPYGPNWSPIYPKQAFVDMVAGVLAAHGVEAVERLRILDVSPPPGREGIVEVLKLADVYLDSFPFCGSTSLIEPLEVGLPIVVKRGTVLRSSMAAAMMEELQLPQLIAAGERAYVDLAIRLGADVDLRRRTAEQVRAAMARGPRFTDSESYARRIAPILRQIAGA